MENLKDRVQEGEPSVHPKHVANGVVDPATKETITKRKKIIADLLLRETWLGAICSELGRFAQGHGDVEGTNTIQFMNLDGISHIPKDRVVTYARMVVD